MKLTYDPRYNIAYLRLHEKPASVETIHVSDLTGQRLHSFQRHKEAIRALAFSADGSVLASGGLDNTVRVWETKSAKEIRRCSEPQATV